MLAKVWVLILWSHILSASDVKDLPEPVPSSPEAREFADLDFRPFMENFYSSKYQSRVVTPQPAMRPHRRKPVVLSVNQQPGSSLDNRFVRNLKQRHTQLQAGLSNANHGMDQQVLSANNYMIPTRGNINSLPNNHHYGNDQQVLPANNYKIPTRPLLLSTPLPSNYQQGLPGNNYKTPPRLNRNPLLSNQHISNDNTPTRGTQPLPGNQEDDKGGYIHSLVQFPKNYNGVLTYFQAEDRPELNIWSGSYADTKNQKNIEIWTRSPNVPFDVHKSGGKPKDITGQSVIPVRLSAGYSIFPTTQMSPVDSPNKKYKTRRKLPGEVLQQKFITNRDKEANNQEDNTNQEDAYQEHSHVVPRRKKVPVNYDRDQTDTDVNGETVDTNADKEKDETNLQDQIEAYHKKWKSKYLKRPSQVSTPEYQTQPVTSVRIQEQPRQGTPAIGTKSQPQDEGNDHMKDIQALIRDVTSGLGTDTRQFKLENERVTNQTVNNKKTKKTKRLKRKRKASKQETSNSEVNTNTTNNNNNDKNINGREYKQLNRSSYAYYNNDPQTEIRYIPVDLNSQMLRDVQGNIINSNAIIYPNNYMNDVTIPSKVIGMKNINSNKAPVSVSADQNMNTYQNNILKDLGYSVLLLKDKNNNNYRTIRNNGYLDEDVKVIKVKRKPKRNNKQEINSLQNRIPIYTNVASIRNVTTQTGTNNTKIVKKVRKKPKVKRTLTRTVKIKKPVYSDHLVNQNYLSDSNANQIKGQSKRSSNQSENRNYLKTQRQITRPLASQHSGPKLSDSTVAGTTQVMGQAKDMRSSPSRLGPQVAYKVTRNGDGTYETAFFQDNENDNNQNDGEEYDDEPEAEKEDKEGQESSHHGHRRMSDVDPEVVEDDGEDRQLRDEDDKEDAHLRHQERADDEINRAQAEEEDAEVQSDMEFDKIKDSIDRIDEEPEDDEPLEDEEEETLFTPEDYEEEDDQDGEQSKAKDKSYVLMPFFLKIPKQKNKRSVLKNERYSEYRDNKVGSNHITKAEELKRRRKREIRKVPPHIHITNQKALLPTERKDNIQTQETPNQNKWQIPIFVIGSEGKDSKENNMPKNDNDNKKRLSSVKFNPFWRDNTFVKAENEFNMESTKAMNANKREDARKMMKNNLLTENNQEKADTSSGQTKANRSKPSPSRLKYPDNYLKQLLNTDDMFDKNRTEIREKRKMFVLNKNMEINTNRNNPQKTLDENEQLENERGLINRINTYTYAQIGQQTPMKNKGEVDKKVKIAALQKLTDKTTRRTMDKTTENYPVSSVKTNLKQINTPVKRFDHDGTTTFDEDEEIKKVEKINKYMEQNNRMKIQPSFHNVNYPSTRRKFSLLSPPGENLFLKKDNLKEDKRQSIPVSERSDEQQFDVSENAFLPRNINKDQKTKTKSGKRSSNSQLNQQNTEHEDINTAVEKRDSPIRPRIQPGKLKQISYINGINQNQTKSERETKSFQSNQVNGKKHQNKMDSTSEKNKMDKNIQESNHFPTQSSTEEFKIKTEIKKMEPEPISPDERKNFRKYSKKRVKEVVIKSATEDPIIKTTVKITDESSKYPTILKTSQKKHRPPPKNNEKETITNHVKYERKIKKQNIGNGPSTMFYDMDSMKTTDSIESQESKIYPDIDKATSPSIRNYQIANGNDPLVSNRKSDTVHNIQTEDHTTQSSIETKDIPRYFKTVIQETASEDSPKTTYYEEIDYKTTMNPNFAKHAKEIRDAAGVPNVNYYDDKMVVTESGTTKNYDDVTPSGIYEEIFGKNNVTEPEGYPMYFPEDKKNPLFNSNSNSNKDYEHQVQKPDLDQKENEDQNSEDYVNPRNKTVNDLLENINNYYDMNYDEPIDDSYYKPNGSYSSDLTNHTSEDIYSNEQMTSTVRPHYELAEEFETGNDHGNIKNHNFNRESAVYPDKQNQYYNQDEGSKYEKPYINDYDGATLYDDRSAGNDSSEHQDTSAYGSNPYLNGKTKLSSHESNAEFPMGNPDMQDGPRMNFYEEDKKYVSESKKIKETPDSESREEDYDTSGGEDYDSGFASTTPVDTSSPTDMKTAGQELNEAHKEASKENGNENHKKGAGEKYEKEKKKSKGKKTKESYDNHHEEESAKKGHSKKEKHKKKYHDAKGEKRKHSEEQGHFGKDEEDEEGEKGAKFEEEGSHEKGHSTKGEHNIHKVNEYMKKHEFYDEHHDGGEHEKHGGFNEHHEHAKGKKEKSGTKEGKHVAGELGKKGMVDRGKKYEDYKKEAKKEGEKKHRAERKEWGEEGARKTGKKWGKDERRR